MKRRTYISLVIAACLAIAILAPFSRREIVPNANAGNGDSRPDAPILRSETLNRTGNQKRHIDRLYQKMETDIVGSMLEPLFLDDSIPPSEQPPNALALGTGDATTIETFGGRSALASIARKLDFDSANGTFPNQSRRRATPISIWLHGSQADIENRVSETGYNPGLSGDVISIDTGVDYLVDDSLIVGLGIGWGSVLSEVAARQVLYRENNVTFSPYFVSRMTEWLNIRGSLGIGSSTIAQSAINGGANDLNYAESLDSATLSSSIGFGAEYDLGFVPVTLSIDGDMITAREKFETARAADGTMVPARTALSQLFDTTAEARYDLVLGDHRLVPFAGQDQTVTLMNQGYGRSTNRRYFAGSEYTYDPWQFGVSVEGFREFPPNVAPLEGIRSEITLQSELPYGYGVLSPYVNGETTGTYLQMAGGITHDWGTIPGQMSIEFQRKLTFATEHNNLSGLLTVHFDF
ncbi:hypothetical protein [Thalassospira alkalitolerans]|uniref:hypothetical protein n=1 Tax=Thalassospira alkalitolerans TaxID=1293890 RepID=UPI0030ED0968